MPSELRTIGWLARIFANIVEDGGYSSDLEWDFEQALENTYPTNAYQRALHNCLTACVALLPFGQGVSMEQLARLAKKLAEDMHSPIFPPRSF